MKRCFAAIVLMIVLILTAVTVNATTVKEKYTAYEYYYNQLNHDEKLVYDGIKTALTGKQTVALTGLESVTTKGAVTTQPQLDALMENCKAAMSPLAQNALDAFVLDHPEFADFAGYMQTQFGGSASGGQGEILVNLAFADIGGYDTRYANMVAEIAKIKASGSALQKVRAIHDFLCGRVTYQDGGSDAHNLYGALMSGKSVCQGYANAFKAACDYYGVPCVCISGMAYTTGGSEAHMWNAVQIDGAWYGVDVTWDDQTSILDDFFLVGSDTVDTHFKKVKFSASHVAEGLQTAASTRAFTYPTLSAKALEGASVTPTPVPATPTPTPKATPKVTATPTAKPTDAPTVKPTEVPVETEAPTVAPTAENVTAEPTNTPEVTGTPTAAPEETPAVTEQPTQQPTTDPVQTDDPNATAVPAVDPTDAPAAPTAEPEKKGCKAELSLLMLAAILPAAMVIRKKEQ